MDETNEVKRLVGAIEKALADGPYGASYPSQYTLSFIVAALRIVTLNMETQYIEAIKARIA